MLKKITSLVYIKGAGGYELDVDKMWTENAFKDHIQVHGHRNKKNREDVQNSFNLEGSVEFGEFLKILEITKDSKELINIKQNIFDPKLEKKEFLTMSFIEKLRDNKYVKENDLGEGFFF